MLRKQNKNRLLWLRIFNVRSASIGNAFVIAKKIDSQSMCRLWGFGAGGAYRWITPEAVKVVQKKNAGAHPASAPQLTPFRFMFLISYHASHLVLEHLNFNCKFAVKTDIGMSFSTHSSFIKNIFIKSMNWQILDVICLCLVVL